MSQKVRRNRLTPWYIGIIIVLAAVVYIGYQMSASNCGVSSPVAIIVLVIVPIVYLVLMYLTLTSQE